MCRECDTMCMSRPAKHDFQKPLWYNNSLDFGVVQQRSPICVPYGFWVLVWGSATLGGPLVAAGWGWGWVRTRERASIVRACWRTEEFTSY
jgi:hypothetical protein